MHCLAKVPLHAFSLCVTLHQKILYINDIFYVTDDCIIVKYKEETDGFTFAPHKNLNTETFIHVYFALLFYFFRMKSF